MMRKCINPTKSPSTEGALYFDENGKRITESPVRHVPDPWAALVAVASQARVMEEG
jgi:hypothetical protein